MNFAIYVVAGFPRSGTSMMMRCLEAGGLECVYSTAGDANRNKDTSNRGYVPNPHGFYEDAPLHSRDWSAFRGRAIKLVRDNFHLVPDGERLEVVYMLRDKDEIERSYRLMLEGPWYGPLHFFHGYREQVQVDFVLLQSLGARVQALDYAAVIAEPARRLESLGWPIDVAKAAAVVDPALYRNRGPA